MEDIGLFSEKTLWDKATLSASTEWFCFVYRHPFALFWQARPTTQIHNTKTYTSTVYDKLPDSIVLSDSIDEQEKGEANDHKSFHSSLKRQLESKSDKPKLKRRKLVQQGLNQQNNNGWDNNQKQYDSNDDDIDLFGLSDFQLFWTPVNNLNLVKIMSAQIKLPSVNNAVFISTVCQHLFTRLIIKRIT